MNLVLGWRTKKLAGYSQESMETITSSTTPSGATVDLSTICKTVAVFLNDPWRFSLSIVSLFVTLMAAPRSIKVWGTMMPLMCTSTTRFTGSRYFGQITHPNIKSDSCPMTLIVGVSLFLLPECWKNFSLINLLWIGTSLIA